MIGRCNNSLKMLFRRGIESLHDDGFEGSMEENSIFRDVFFGHGNDKTSKKCLVTGTISFEKESKKPKDVLFGCNSDNSVMTTHTDFQNMEESEEFTMLARNDPGVEVKRRKLLLEEQVNAQKYVEKVVNSLIPSEDVADKDASKSRLSSSDTNDQKGKESNAATAIASPISQESHASKLLVITSEPIQISKRKWKDSSFVKLDEDELLAPPKELTTDPRPLVRFHTNRLFMAAKWVIGRRKRKRTTHRKGHGEFVFKSPSGRPVREFYRAWNMCGQKLIEDANYVVGDNDGIRWTSLAEFISAFSDTVREIEELIRNLEPATALAHWWFLLDPFAKVVFIDKSLAYLKKEKLVETKVSKKYKGTKGTCKLRPQRLTKVGQCDIKGRWSGLGVRTVLSWLIDFGVIKLNEVIQYRNIKNDLVVKDGLITRDGIRCRCCKEILSVSEFKNHAGFNLKSACNQNLFLESGKPFTLCQLDAWSAEYKVRRSAIQTIQAEDIDEYDDNCGLCGDGGELICCGNCPSTFHPKCLCVEELPEANWYCSKCSCWICGNVVNDKEASSMGALKCLQCEHKYHEECLREKGMERLLVSSDTWLCGQSCKEVYMGLRSQIGIMNPIVDGLSWTLLKCIHGDLKAHTAQHPVALKAECNLKLAVALTIMEECFLPMVDSRTSIDMIPHVLYNWGSEFARLNYEGFYTLILEKNDVILCVASVRIHGVDVAEMPLIATCSKYRRQGMCRHLMNAIEQMLKSLKVQKLVISAIPSLVDTWTQGFGFTPLEADEKKKLTKTSLMVFPGSVWLKKPLYQGAIQCAPPTKAASTSPEDMIMPIISKDGDQNFKLLLEELEEALSKAKGGLYKTGFEPYPMKTGYFQPHKSGRVPKRGKYKLYI